MARASRRSARRAGPTPRRHRCLARDPVHGARGGRAVATLLEVTEQFPPGQLFGRLSAFAAPYPEVLARTVIADWRPYITRLHYVERAVALCADLRHPIPIEELDQLLTETRTRDQRLLTAQLLRARGIQERDASNLREALAMFETFGARPLVARTQVELGQIEDDPDLAGTGTAALDALGDVTQLGRVAAAIR